MQTPVDFSIDDSGIGVVCVNRPAARNALNWAAQAQFADIVAQLAAGRLPQVRVLIVCGAGERAFVAGGDLKELAGHPEPEAGERLNRTMSAALMQLTRLPIPVIGAVNGDAFGGGCEIVTACDLVIAAESARFCFAQAKNGLTTGWGGAGRLVQRVGLGRGLDLLLTARLMGSAEAQQIGLVQRIVPAGQDVVVAATDWAHELVALPREALAGLKQLARFAADHSLAESAQLETALFTALWSSPDHREALAAFGEKRKPVFNQQE